MQCLSYGRIILLLKRQRKLIKFLVKVDSLLKGLRERLYTKTYTSDEKAGGLAKEWAQRLGLKEGIAVTVGAFDAHMGAVGVEIKEKTFNKFF